MAQRHHLHLSAPSRLRLTLSLALVGTLAVPAGLRAQAAGGSDAPIPDGEGTLAGEVRAAENSEPLPGALVVIREREVGTETNEHGRFAFRRFASGRYTVEVRYLGRRSKTVEAVVRPGRITHLELDLETEVVELPGLQVAVERSYRGKMAGFWERKRSGIGHYVTREQIAKTPGNQLHQVFRGLAGLRVKRCGRGSSTGCYRLVSSRQTAAFGGCLDPKVYVDGARIPLQDYPLGINEMRPEQVEAAEVYTGPSQIPAQFGGSDAACGVIVIWTRSPGLAAGEGDREE